MEVFQLHYLRA